MSNVISPLSKLQASQAYNRVNSADFTKHIENFPGQAVDFKPEKSNFNNSVTNIFNAYSQMTPEQILATIKNSPAVISQSSAVGQILGSLRKPIESAESVTKQALLGEASLVDLATATTNMGIAVETVVALRNKLIEQLDKIFNINI